MEAKTLTKKKTSINKVKIKKTIKNILGRPDPVFWPVLSVENENKLKMCLSQYKVAVPTFKKPHWKELKDIPKEKRLKPVAIKKIDGLSFGMSECLSNIPKGDCSAIIIDSGVNPRTIIHPILEECITKDLPVVCMKNLRKTSLEFFGITTSCLGLKSGHLLDLRNKISEVAKTCKPPNILIKNRTVETLDMEKKLNSTALTVPKVPEVENVTIECPYLYRSNNKTRVFVPSGETNNITKSFAGQNFIEISEKPKEKCDRKAYMNMILKRVTNNPNRAKKKIKIM